jgi:hypothetical protein
MVTRNRFVAVLLFFLAGPHLFPQEVEIRPILALSSSATEAQWAAVIKVTSNLVLLPVYVTNRAGASVNGLGPDAFSVFEDKVAQPVSSASGITAFWPTVIALTSWSSAANC